VTRALLARGGATIDQAGVGLLAAREATVNNSAVGLLIAGRVNGEVKPLLGLREAAVFGAVAGGVVGLILWLKDRWGGDRANL
jgi:hypothetical protein